MTSERNPQHHRGLPTFHPSVQKGATTMTATLSPRPVVRRDVDTHPTVSSVVYRAQGGVTPFPGQVWRHLVTGLEAEFQHWRQQPAFLGGRWVMVLFHPRFGECRWAPGDAAPVEPVGVSGNR